MRGKTTNVSLISEVAAALIADGCRGDRRAAERLRSDCGTALNDLDVRVPDGVDVRVAENTPDTVHVPLPHYSYGVSSGADAMSMSEEELRQISAGEVVLAVAFTIGIAVTIVFGVVVGSLAGSGVLSGGDSPSEPGAATTARVNTVGGDPGLS